MTDERPAWKLTWGDHTFTEADVTVEVGALLEIVYGDSSWATQQRSPWDSLTDTAAYLTALLAVADRRDALEVRVELAAVPRAALIDALDVAEAEDSSTLSAEQQSEDQ